MDRAIPAHHINERSYKMKTSQSNAIASLVKTSQGASVKVVPAPKASLTLLDIVGLASEAGQASFAISKADATIESAKKIQESNYEILNKKASSIKVAGYVLADGRKQDANTKTIKQAFIDSLGDLADATKQAYYEIFRKAVNDGKKITSMNKTEGGRKVSKKTEGKPEATFANVLASLYNHSEFESLSEATQAEVKAILVAEEYLDA